MRRKTVAVICGAFVGLVAPNLEANARSLLSGEEIRDVVSGKRVYLQVPLGGEFPLYYRANGRVDGSGEAVGLGKYMRPNDSGRWWIRDDSLCQKWRSWYKGKPFCFTLRQDGSELYWRRNDGYSGTARIGG